VNNSFISRCHPDGGWDNELNHYTVKLTLNTPSQAKEIFLIHTESIYIFTS